MLLTVYKSYEGWVGVSALVDPGPPTEEELNGVDPTKEVLERLKQTVSRLPKRRQHLPGHPRCVQKLVDNYFSSDQNSVNLIGKKQIL